MADPTSVVLEIEKIALAICASLAAGKFPRQPAGEPLGDAKFDGEVRHTHPKRIDLALLL
jgi:hypothetical protein